MSSDATGHEYDYPTEQGTGSHGESEDYKIINYPFEKYEIKVKLTSRNEFVAITEVRINKEFMSHKQKMSSEGFGDLSEFYEE